jgi:hygromycin-B 4-O-kinase
MLLGAGAWSQAYSFTLDGKESVIRFGAHGDDFAKDQIMGELATSPLRVPKVLEIGETSEGFFIVSERAYGGFLDDLPSDQMRDLLPTVFSLLDVLAEIDVSQRQGFGLWTADGSAPHSTWGDALLSVAEDRPRLAGWRSALENSPPGTASFEKAYAVLTKLVPDLPNERKLVHGDLLYHNVLVQDGKITAVLDWGNSLYGDPLYEAAWLIYCWPWSPQWSDIDIRAELDGYWARQGRVPSDVERRLLAYQIHIGLGQHAFNAFTGNWEAVALNARITTELAERAGSRL